YRAPAPPVPTRRSSDLDCDRRVDEGVTNACGTCGATPAETCNGRDEDCDGKIDEGDVCEIILLNEQPSAYAPPASTDVNGDQRRSEEHTSELQSRENLV